MYVLLFLLSAGDEAEIDLSGKYQTSRRKDGWTQANLDSLSISSVKIRGCCFTEPGNCFAQILLWTILFPRKCAAVFTVGSTSINMLLVSPSIINTCVLQRAYSSIFSPESCRHQSLRDILWSPTPVSNEAPLHPLPLHLKLLQCQAANHHHR